MKKSNKMFFRFIFPIYFTFLVALISANVCRVDPTFALYFWVSLILFFVSVMWVSFKVVVDHPTVVAIRTRSQVEMWEHAVSSVQQRESV